MNTLLLERCREMIAVLDNAREKGDHWVAWDGSAMMLSPADLICFAEIEAVKRYQYRFRSMGIPVSYTTIDRVLQNLQACLEHHHE